MADWLSITDSAVDPNAPVTSELAYAWRDNPIAIAEGASGAPRIRYSAIQKPSAGSGTVFTSIPSTSALASTTVGILGMSCLIDGYFTLSVSAISLAVSGSAFKVNRVRNGVTSIVESPTATGDYTIGARYGDRFFFNLTSSSSGSSSVSFSITHNGDSPAFIANGAASA